MYRCDYLLYVQEGRAIRVSQVQLEQQDRAAQQVLRVLSVRQDYQVGRVV